MEPNYSFKLPKIFSYVPVVLLAAVLLSGLSLYFLSEYEFVSYLLAAVFLFIGFGIGGIYLTVRSFTDLNKRLIDRDVLLDAIPWQGNESVLDVGCGNGILILSAAKRIPDGKAIGIDMWTENSGDNRKDVFEKNAQLEGVAERVSVETQDARSLPYADASFDVILCGLTMHHILHDTGADKVVSEMLRVVKPGGYIGVYDVPIAILSTTKLLQKEHADLTKVNSKILLAKKMSNRH